MGFGSSRDYEKDIRQSIMVDELRKAVTGSSRISESDVRGTFNRQYGQRVIEAIIVNPDTVLAGIELDEKAAQAWYEGHKDSYRSPLRAKVNVVDIDPAELAKDISVDEKEIRTAYEERKNEFSVPEERKARHILVKVAPDA